MKMKIRNYFRTKIRNRIADETKIIKLEVELENIGQSNQTCVSTPGALGGTAVTF